FCGGSYIQPVLPGMDECVSSEDSPTYVSAKASRYAQEKQIATLAGYVVLRKGSMQVEGDEANLHELEDRGELVGNVKLRDKG
ncbi:LptA/OstA family protein, partial [Pseudomonas aeruginosa]